MAASIPAIAVDDFIKQPEVLNCLDQLEKRFGKNGERLIISDVLDPEGHQYVNLVQKGGGVLGVALVGYTYILEQMNIRFIRLAGTSAGAINTALMTVIGGQVTSIENGVETKKMVQGDKKKAKSEEILKAICDLNFFDLVDGHPAARWLIKNFITHKDFAEKTGKWIKWIIGLLIAFPVIDFILLGLQHQFPVVSFFTKLFFVITGFYFLLVVLIVAYLLYLITRLKDSGFGINPGDFFYNWIKKRLIENDVQTVSDLLSKASTPVPGLYLRTDNPAKTTGLDGDVTFITSELVTQNKIEFPKMWNLFREDKDLLQPAGFVRASMSIPVFFESYFINGIPQTSDPVKKAWQALGEENPPATTRFVDGGILSNFPINLFYNPNVEVPRLPSFGIDLDDNKDPADQLIQADTNGRTAKVDGKDSAEAEVNDTGDDAGKWSLGGYVYRLFNTVRFYYDKDFLIKNVFYKKGIGVIPLKGFGWLNFFLEDKDKKEMFVLGAKAATQFLNNFNWEEYKTARKEMQRDLTGNIAPGSEK